MPLPELDKQFGHGSDANTGRDSGARITLDKMPPAVPLDQDPNVIFKNAWLDKGGGALFVAPSGQGKSTFNMHAALCWASGRAFFGIKPMRPLNIVMIQAEDNHREVTEHMEHITRGMMEIGDEDGITWTAAEVKKAKSRIAWERGINGRGEDLAAQLNSMLLEFPETDLVMLNPLFTYSGCTLTKNEELTVFLRDYIDGVIKTRQTAGKEKPHRCAIIITHHTNKPPSVKDRESWNGDGLSSYLGAGGAELTNWARATIALLPMGSVAPGCFEMIADKRGGRIGWKDENGVKTNRRYVSHNRDFIYWRDPYDDQLQAIEEAKQAKAKKGCSLAPRPTRAVEIDPARASAIMAAHGQPVGKLELVELLAKFGRRAAIRFADIAAEGRVPGIIAIPGKRSGEFIYNVQ